MNIRALELEPLMAALRTMQDAAIKRTLHKLKVKQNEDQAPQPGPTGDRVIQPLPYDAASVFLLEMMTGIVLNTRQHVYDVW